MLLRYFNFSYPSRLVSVLLLAAFLWLPSLIMPVTLSNPQWISPLFELYLSLPIHAMWVNVAIAFLINSITALTVNSLAVHFGLSKKSSYLTAFLYLLFSSALPETTQMSPFLLINFFLSIYLLNVFRLSSDKKDIPLSFNGAFIIGLTTLLFPPMAFLLIAHFIILRFNRVNNIRAYFGAVIGWLLPFVYLFTYYFWKDSARVMWSIYLDSFKLRFALIYPDDVLSDILLGVMAVFIVAAGWREYLNLYRRKISKRRNIGSMLTLLFVLAFIYLFYATETELFVLFSVPVAIILNDYFRFVKRMKLAEIAILVLFFITMFNQYFYWYYAS